MAGYVWERYKMLTITPKAFREEYVSTESLNAESFSDYRARRLRYEVLWAQYQNDVYRNVHKWAQSYKTRFALYQYIRSIYNPAYRLGEFWKSHLWGGTLDPDADDKGALPIVTDNERVRPAIRQIWQWSNWQTRKDIITLCGAIMGDIFIRIIDDEDTRRVYLEMLHPGLVSALVKDAYGNVKAYEITDERVHPVTRQKVVYRETVERAGMDVVYTVYFNDAVYQSWSIAYGFTPLVHVQHNDVGLDWGWSELHPSRSKMHEVDELGSMLSDQVRKSLHSSGLAYAGYRKPDTALVPSSYAARQAIENLPDQGRPELGREEVNAYYSTNPDAIITPVSIPVDVAGTIAHIQGILEELERDYPELKFDRLRASGDASGKALRIARQPAETKVKQRRANYDDALVRAHQMAISIAALRGYFTDFTADSYATGALAHDIGERPVFYADPVDRYEEDEQFWKAATQATQAGLPLVMFLEDAGWSPERIQRFQTLQAERQQQAISLATGSPENAI